MPNYKLRAPDFSKRNLPDFRRKYSIPFYNEVAHIINGETIVHKKVTKDCLMAMRWKLVEEWKDGEIVPKASSPDKKEDVKDTILSQRAKKAWATRRKNLKEKAKR